MLALLLSLAVLTLLPGLPLETAPASEILTVDGRNASRWTVQDPDGRPLIYPTRLIVQTERLFILDSGRLLALPFYPGQPATLLADIVSPERGPEPRRIGEVVMHELVDFAALPDGRLLVLDKMGNLFSYTPSTGNWALFRGADLEGLRALSVPVALTTVEDHAYLLDTGLGQVYRIDGPKSAAAGLFPDTSEDAAGAAGLAVNDALYLMRRDGSVRAYRGGRPTGQPPLAPNPVRSAALPSLLAPPGDSSLYYVDPEASAIIAIDRERWSEVRRYRFEDGGPRHPLRTAAVAGGRIWAILGSDLTVYPRPGRPDVP